MSYNRVPIAASKDYETICNYAKKWCEYILDYGDSVFSNSDEPLCIWTGYNYYTVGTPNQRERIIFRVSEVKVLKDLNQKVDPNDKNW